MSARCGLQNATWIAHIECIAGKIKAQVCVCFPTHKHPLFCPSFVPQLSFFPKLWGKRFQKNKIFFRKNDVFSLFPPSKPWGKDFFGEKKEIFSVCPFRKLGEKTFFSSSLSPLSKTMGGKETFFREKEFSTNVFKNNAIVKFK